MVQEQGNTKRIYYRFSSKRACQLDNSRTVGIKSIALSGVIEYCTYEAKSPQAPIQQSKPSSQKASNSRVSLTKLAASDKSARALPCNSIYPKVDPSKSNKSRLEPLHNARENFLAAQAEPCSWYSWRVMATFFNSSLLVANCEAPSHVERTGLIRVMYQQAREEARGRKGAKKGKPTLQDVELAPHIPQR